MTSLRGRIGIAALAFALAALDLASASFAQFGRQHPIAASLVSGLVLLLLAATLIEGYLARIEAKKWDPLVDIAYKHLWTALVDVSQLLHGFAQDLRLLKERALEGGPSRCDVDVRALREQVLGPGRHPEVEEDPHLGREVYMVRIRFEQRNSRVIDELRLVLTAWLPLLMSHPAMGSDAPRLQDLYLRLHALPDTIDERLTAEVDGEAEGGDNFQVAAALRDIERLVGTAARDVDEGQTPTPPRPLSARTMIGQKGRKLLEQGQTTIRRALKSLDPRSRR